MQKKYGNPLILLVDDQISDLELNQIALLEVEPSLQIEVFQAGMDLVGFLREHKNGLHGPILLFLDLKMPKVSGFDVLDILQNENLGSFPIIILSSSSLPEDTSRALQGGATACYEKPLSLKETKALFEMILSSFLVGETLK